MAEPQRQSGERGQAASVSGLCEVGADRVTCVVADPIHRRIYHGAWGEERAAEPQQANAPTPGRLLELLQSLRDEMSEVDDRGYAGSLGDAFRVVDQIEGVAVAPRQQPIQARSWGGLPLWIHGCGAIADRAEQPGPFACSTLGCTKPWRPLLVGGTRAPEGDGRCPTCDSPQPSMHPAIGGGGEVTGLCSDPFHSGTPTPEAVSLVPDDDRLRTLGEDRSVQWLEDLNAAIERVWPGSGWTPTEQPQPDLIAQVMAELGVTDPAEVLDALGALLRLAAESEQNAEKLKRSKELFLVAARRGDKAESECDEARAEVERQAQQLAQRLVGLERERDEARAGWERNRSLLDDVAALLDVPETGDLLDAVRRVKDGRDEARAEVERLNEQLNSTVDLLYRPAAPPRVALFMGPDAAKLAAAYVAMANGRPS